MKEPQSPHPQVAASKKGDVLVIQGPGIPILFFSKSQVAALLDSPESANAIFITDIGAAAVEALLAGNASFEAIADDPGSSLVPHVTLRFRLPNGLSVAYTTDPKLTDCGPEQLKAMDVDIVVTDRTIGWDRQHLQFINGVISQAIEVPPMPTSLRLFDAKTLSQLVRDSLAQTSPNSVPDTNPGGAS